MESKIIELLTQSEKSVQELSELLQCHDAKLFKQLVKTLAKLEQKKRIVLTKTGKFRTPYAADTHVTGIYRANDKGFGFVTVEGLDEDVYIPKGKQGTAMSGDTVQVTLTKEADKWAGKGAEGVISQIENRSVQNIVGEFVRYPQSLVESSGYIGYIIPKDKKISEFTCFILPNSLQVVDGTICSVEITQYPQDDGDKSLIGIIKKEIGYKDAPGVDILTVLHKHGVPIDFSQKTLEQADSFSLTVEVPSDRVDLRNDCIITIDGEDAKDLDDAISLKVLDNGLFELGVHIADVSHYVQENTPLDQEAYERATSVYLTDRVVPMLPQRLSNGICSLHPDEDRLTMSCVMQIDSNGDVKDYRIFNSVIRSQKRMTYTRVNRVLLEGDTQARDEYLTFIPLLERMRDLHYTLYHKRRRRGAIDFDSIESKIIVDEQGKPLDIELRERGVAERMIESFMLCANETVAHHFIKHKELGIYRVHERPAEEKMQKFMEFVTNFGIMMKGTSEQVTSKALQKVLSQVEDKPYEPVVSTVLLRSMKQARYDVEPLGHYGLATTDYTHFTSPIRRYPDLIVHRLLKRMVTHTVNVDEDVMLAKLEDIAQQSSLMERRAVECEREVDTMKKAEFMLDKIGEKFEGMVSSVTRFGVFVSLPNTVEGLIHVSKMNDDHYDFIENHLMLIGKRTGKSYQIGQRVEIVVSKVDLETRDIDFEFVLSDKEKQHTNRRKQFGDSRGGHKQKKTKSKKMGSKKQSFSDKRPKKVKSKNKRR